MKIGLLLLITAAILGGLVGTLMLRDPGYVLVAYADRVLETSFWFALLLLVLAYAVLRLFFFVALRTFRSGQFFDAWRARRSGGIATRQTERGLVLLAEGEWAEAKKLLTGSARGSALPFVNFLNAAQAAHELGNADERDELLLRAEEAAPGTEVAVSLARAHLQMEAQQWAVCRATLTQLRQRQPRHPRLLKLLAQCHEALEDWVAFIELLPELRKARAMEDPTLEAAERRAWAGRLETEDYADVWQRLPRELKREPELIAARARQLIVAGETAAAEQALRKALNRGWHDELIELYGRIAAPDPAKQLAAAQHWLKDRPEDPSLLLALGRIAMMGGFWSSARDYLEESLRLKPCVATHGELGRLLSHLGEFIRGSEHLGMACPELPNLRLPPRPGR